MRRAEPAGAVRRLSAALALVVCAGAALLAAAWGAADLLALPARGAMADWEQRGAPGERDEWDEARAGLERARRLNPLSADYAFDLGRLYEWQALSEAPWAAHARAQRAAAIAHFRAAAVLRPSWGFAWAHLAASKVLNQELDAEAIAALDRALVLAPWEQGTQRKALWIGMSIRDALPPAVRERLMGVLANALRDQPREIIDLAVASGWSGALGPLLEREPDKKYLAKKVKREG